MQEASVSIVGDYCPSSPLWTTSCCTRESQGKDPVSAAVPVSSCQHIRSSLNSHHILYEFHSGFPLLRRVSAEKRSMYWNHQALLTPVWSLQVFLFPERNYLNFAEEGQYLCIIEHQSSLKILAHNAVGFFIFAKYVVCNIWYRSNQTLDAWFKYNYSENVNNEHANGTINVQ